MRIYELAKKLGVKNNSILYELSKLGIEGKKHSSNIDSTLAKRLEDILLKESIEQKEFDKKERLQTLRKLSKDRLGKYLSYKFPDTGSEYISLWKGIDSDGKKEKEGIEKTKPLNKEFLKTDFPDVTISSQEIRNLNEIKQKGYRNQKTVIAVLILSAIFIIGVMLINYYVWKDRTYGRSDIKSLDQPIQKEKSILLFTLQAGAFNDAYYAKALMKKLIEKGYPAFITISYSNEKRFYKVFIGKFSERTEAEKMSVKIKDADGIYTFVTLWDKNYFHDSEPTSHSIVSDLSI
ncbi:MAG: translation initiation factor IF-2 N-terminal domain-containing protein [Nitrospirae bacterium]|nr:translation initiation factor IF-2 N-terminal domain-containing protein [Nitrospirota bacterium]